MEMHFPENCVVAKKLWNFLRIAYFMMRKGLISKRKLIMDMNLMMKRGKLLRKTVSNLMFHHHHHHHHSRNVTRGGAGFGLQEYEFSCSNSPNPVFFHVSKRKHHYFPCINPPPDDDEADDDNPEELQAASAAVVVFPKIECSPEYNLKFRVGKPNLAPAGEKLSPLLSPFSVRVSNFSSDDEINEMGINPQVDDDAEEFIRRFYEQLRMQSRTQLLEYQASP